MNDFKNSFNAVPNVFNCPSIVINKLFLPEFRICIMEDLLDPDSQRENVCVSGILLYNRVSDPYLFYTGTDPKPKLT